jgi:hypothetical protein
MTAAAALLITLAVEVPVATLAGGPPRGRVALAALAASLLTHPLAWWANTALPYAFPVRAALIEVAVTLAEAALYRALVPLPAGRALLTSCLANAASFGLGLLLA